jgi:urease accessory protein UreH
LSTLEAWDLDLTISVAGGLSTVTNRLYRFPFVLGTAFRDVGADRIHLALQSSSGSIIAGDSLRSRFLVEEDAWVRITDQGAMSVNFAPAGHMSAEYQSIRARSGARVEMLSQPRVLHSGAHHQSRIQVDLQNNARVLLVDSFIIHQEARTGRYSSSVRILADGVLAALEQSTVEFASLSPLASRAHAVVWYLGRLPETSERGLASCIDDGTYSARFMLPNHAGAAVRIAAESASALLQGIEFWVANFLNLIEAPLMVPAR